MLMHTDLLIYLAVAAGTWITYTLVRHRRQRGQIRRGDAGAYEGNLIVPAAGQAHGVVPGHSAHRIHHAHAGHVAHHAAHPVGGGHH
jgi:hypothetical protein